MTRGPARAWFTLAPLMSVVVLISGRGSNMQAILEAGIPVAAVISNRADAAGLAIAAGHGVPTAVVDHRRFATREAFDAALAREIEGHAPRLVALAGFMRILTPGFVARFAGRIVNIHPSLLPEFPGLDTHARARSGQNAADMANGPGESTSPIPETLALLATLGVKESYPCPVCADLLEVK